MTWAVLSESMAGVLPSASSTLAPCDHAHRPEGRVRVRAVADGNADRVALLLEHLALLQQLVPCLRAMLEARLLEVGHVVGARERDPEPRDGSPAGLGLSQSRPRRGTSRRTSCRCPRRCRPRRRAGSRRGTDRRSRVGIMSWPDCDWASAAILGGQLQVGDGVHAHRAVVGLAEGLRLLAQLVVGGGDEVVPARGRSARASARRRAPVPRASQEAIPAVLPEAMRRN